MRRRDAVEDDDVREDRKRGGVHRQWLIAAGAMLATYKNARRRAFAALYAIPNSKQQKRFVAPLVTSVAGHREREREREREKERESRP